jgi:malonyl-CoA O-methyltransferase
MTRLLDRTRVRRAFGGAAASYDQVAGLQREIAERLLSRLDYIRHQPETILDCGAGTGYASGLLSKHYGKARILALDFAESMLQSARHRGRWLRPVRPLCADAEHLPLAAQKLDLICSNAMLQWCDQPGAVFAEWLRVTRHGGLLMFSTFGPGTLGELEQAWASVDDYPHVSSFVDIRDLGDQLMAAGWEGVVLDIDRIRLHYEDLPKLLRDIKTLGASNAVVGRRPGLTGKGHIAHLTRAYEALREADGLPVSYEVIYGHAWAPKQRQLGAVTQVPLEGISWQR